MHVLRPLPLPWVSLMVTFFLLPLSVSIFPSSSQQYYSNYCPDHNAHYGPTYQTRSSPPLPPYYNYYQTSPQYPQYYQYQQPNYNGNGYSYGNDVRRTGLTSPSQSTAGRPTGIVPYPRPTGFYNALYGSVGSSPYGYATSGASSYYYGRPQPQPPNYYAWQQYYQQFLPPPSPAYYQSQPYEGPYPEQRFGDPYNPMGPMMPKEAQAIMKGNPSTAIGGSIDFCQVGDRGVMVKGKLTGLPGTDSNKAVIILKDTKCPPLAQFPVDQKTMEHYNPFNSNTHGPRDSPHKHIGDLGNFFTQFDGTGIIDFTTNQISLDDPIYSIVNRTVIITEKEDDLGSNPNDPESKKNGNSGRAIACGVITLVPSSMPQPSNRNDLNQYQYQYQYQQPPPYGYNQYPPYYPPPYAPSYAPPYPYYTQQQQQQQPPRYSPPYYHKK